MTQNPFNRILDAGGSAGGEGALLALRGSCLGISSDLCEETKSHFDFSLRGTNMVKGGNVRSPAASNGFYGFKPTGLRIPKLGLSTPETGCGYLSGSVGPLSTSFEGIKLFMRAVLGTKPWLEDASLRSLPWRDAKSDLLMPGCKRLRVGVMWNDGIVKPQPPVGRALKEVVDRLKDIEEVDVFDWKPYKHDVAWDITVSMASALEE